MTSEYRPWTLDGSQPIGTAPQGSALSKYAPWFGIPDWTPGQDSSNNRNRAALTLPDYYRGQSKFFQNSLGVVLLSGNNSILQYAIPVVPNDGPFQEDFSVYEYPAVLVGLVPPNAPVRIVTANKISGTSSIERRGLGMMLNHDFMDTPLGREMYVNHLRQIIASFDETMTFDAINALAITENYYIRESLTNNTFNPSEVRTIIKRIIDDEIKDWARLQDSTIANPWIKMDDDITQTNKLYNPNTNLNLYIVDYRCTAFRKTVSPSQTDYSKFGPGVQQNITRTIQAIETDERGNRVINISSFLAGIHVVSPLEQKMEIGEWWLCTARHISDFSAYRSEFRRTTVYDEDSDEMVPLSLAQFVDHCERFNKNGTIRNINDLPYKDGRHNVSAQVLAQDMLHYYDKTTNQAIPITLVGQLRNEHFTADDYQKFSATVFAQLARISDITASNCDQAIRVLQGALRLISTYSYDNNMDFWIRALSLKHRSVSQNSNINAGVLSLADITPNEHGSLDFEINLNQGSDEERQLYELIGPNRWDYPPTHGNYAGFQTIKKIVQRQPAPVFADSLFNYEKMKQVADAITTFENMVYHLQNFFPECPLLSPQWDYPANHAPSAAHVVFDNLVSRAFPQRPIFVLSPNSGNTPTVPRSNFTGAPADSGPFVDFRQAIMNKFLGNMVTRSADSEYIAEHIRGPQDDWRWATRQTPSIKYNEENLTPGVVRRFAGNTISPDRLAALKQQIDRGETIDFNGGTTQDQVYDDVARFTLYAAGENLSPEQSLVYLDVLALLAMVNYNSPALYANLTKLLNIFKRTITLDLTSWSASSRRALVANIKEHWETLSGTFISKFSKKALTDALAQHESLVARPSIPSSAFSSSSSQYSEGFPSSEFEGSSSGSGGDYPTLTGARIEGDEAGAIFARWNTPRAFNPNAPQLDPARERYTRTNLTLGATAVRTWPLAVFTRGGIRFAIPASWSNLTTQMAPNEILAAYQYVTDPSPSEGITKIIGEIFNPNYSKGQIEVENLPIVRLAKANGRSGRAIQEELRTYNAQVREEELDPVAMRDQPKRRRKLMSGMDSSLSSSTAMMSRQVTETQLINSIMNKEKIGNLFSYSFIDDRFKVNFLAILNKSQINLASQVVAMILLFTPFTKQFLLATSDNNLYHPVDYLNFRPHALYDALTAIKMFPSAEQTAYMNFGRVLTEQYNDGSNQRFYLDIHAYTGVTIRNPKNIQKRRGVQVTGYHRGMGTDFIRPETYKPNVENQYGTNPRQSIITTMIPLNWRPNGKSIAMAGSLTIITPSGHEDVRNYNGDEFGYPTSVYYSRLYGFTPASSLDDHSKPIPAIDDSMVGPVHIPNRVCHKGYAGFEAPKGSYYSAPQGHWKKEFIGPCTRSIRYGIQSGATNRYLDGRESLVY